MQLTLWEARSLSSHWFWGELVPQPPVTPGDEQLVFSTTMCQPDMSKL